MQFLFLFFFWMKNGKKDTAIKIGNPMIQNIDNLLIKLRHTFKIINRCI
jgi:hypothetical protein